MNPGQSCMTSSCQRLLTLVLPNRMKRLFPLFFRKKFLNIRWFLRQWGEFWSRLSNYPPFSRARRFFPPFYFKCLTKPGSKISLDSEILMTGNGCGMDLFNKRRSIHAWTTENRIKLYWQKPRLSCAGPNIILMAQPWKLSPLFLPPTTEKTKDFYDGTHRLLEWSI